MSKFLKTISKNARKNNYVDPTYNRFPLGNHAQGKEAWALLAGCALVTPLMPVAPFYVGTLYYSAWNYYSKHKKSHQDIPQADDSSNPKRRKPFPPTLSHLLAFRVDRRTPKVRAALF